jgi:hypothetical protein
VVTLIGSQAEYLAPATEREYLFATFANLLCYALAIYFIATLSSIISTAGEKKREQDILLDNYLEMFDTLRLDTRLKYTV